MKTGLNSAAAQGAGLLLALALLGCGGGGSGGAGGGDDFGEAPAAIAAKLGISGAVVRDGELPPPSSLGSAPELSAPERDLIVAPGTEQTVPIAVDLDDGAVLQALLAKVVGSDTLFEVAQGRAATKRIDGKLLLATVLRVSLGADLQARAFCLDVLARDSAGRISNLERICFSLPANNPQGEQPLANAGPDQLVAVGEAVQLVGSGVSPGAAVTSFAWTQTGGEPVALNGQASSILSFQAPQLTATAVLSFRLQISDDQGRTASDEVRVTVEPPSAENRLPLAEAGPPSEVQAEREAVLRGDDLDPDGSIASREWTQIDGPPVALSGADTRTARFLAPRLAQTTLLSFRYRVVDDDGAAAEDGVTVTVFAEGTAVNQPPVANAGQDQQAVPAATVVLNGAASADADGSITGFAWAQIGGPGVSLNGADTVQPSFVAPDAAGSVLEFLLTVSDEQGASGADSVRVSLVAATTAAPQAAAGPDRTVPPGTMVVLDGSGSSGGAGEGLSFEWTQIGGVTVSLQDADSAMASFTAPQAAEGSVLSFQLTVIDAQQRRDSDQVEITLGTPAAEPSRIQFVEQSLQVDEQAGLLGVAININPPAAEEISLPFNVSGTATAGSDFVVDTPSPLTIPAGSGSATIQLTLIDDGSPEADENLVLTLLQPSAGTLGTGSEIVVTIVEGGSAGPTALLAVTEGDELLRFRADAPGTLEARVQIDPNDIVTDPGSFPFAIGLDVRPATAEIYMLQSDGRLYTVSLSTGDAVLIGRLPQALIDADIRAMAFDPRTDEIRLCGVQGENFRVSPLDASLIATDTTLFFAPGDPNAGPAGGPSGLDYSGTPSSAGRTAFVLEDFSDTLSRLGDADDAGNSANSGQLRTLANLQFGATGDLAVEALTPTGYTLRPGARTGHTDLGRLDLTTGALTLLGEIGNEDGRFVILVLTVAP